VQTCYFVCTTSIIAYTLITGSGYFLTHQDLPIERRLAPIHIESTTSPISQSFTEARRKPRWYDASRPNTQYCHSLLTSRLATIVVQSIITQGVRRTGLHLSSTYSPPSYEARRIEHHAMLLFSPYIGRKRGKIGSANDGTTYTPGPSFPTT
jgi:hypothetical protein